MLFVLYLFYRDEAFKGEVLKGSEFTPESSAKQIPQFLSKTLGKLSELNLVTRHVAQTEQTNDSKAETK